MIKDKKNPYKMRMSLFIIYDMTRSILIIFFTISLFLMNKEQNVNDTKKLNMALFYYKKLDEKL
jgi:hypothetical protein